MKASNSILFFWFSNILFEIYEEKREVISWSLKRLKQQDVSQIQQ